MLNVFSQPKTGQSQMVRFDDVIMKYSEQDLEKELNYFKSSLNKDNLQIELISMKGDLVDAVEKIGIKHDLDLIVMGTKGSNILKELLLGSDTDRLVRLSRVPVLVIPEKVDFVIPKKVVFATELEECKNPYEFKKLTHIIKDFKAVLLVLNVYRDKAPPVAFFELKMNEALEGVKHSFHYVQNEDTAEGISDFVSGNEAGLLALVDYKTSLLGKLFRHSITSKFAHSAELPLLIIHG